MTLDLPAEVPVEPAHYQRLVQKVTGKPEERIISYLMLRSLKQARYAPDALGHFALAFQEYTHFTSPIRRYPDLIVHRVLKWALDHPPSAPNDSAGPFRKPELQSIAEESSEDERRAEAAERELVSWKTAQFMEQHLGDEFDALIVSVQKFGFFVELMEVFVEGLVPVTRLEELTGSTVFYRKRDHSLVSAATRSGSGRKGKPTSKLGAEYVWKLGDRIRVCAERIDPLRRRVEFAPLL